MNTNSLPKQFPVHAYMLQRALVSQFTRGYVPDDHEEFMFIAGFVSAHNERVNAAMAAERVKRQEAMHR